MQQPKVIINLIAKNGKAYRMVGLANKMRRRTTASLMNKIKLNDIKRCTLKVIYGRSNNQQIDNEMEIKNFADIRWALNAFLDKTLWINYN